jgi:D-amino-acid oxidase
VTAQLEGGHAAGRSPALPTVPAGGNLDAWVGASTPVANASTPVANASTPLARRAAVRRLALGVVGIAVGGCTAQGSGVRYAPRPARTFARPLVEWDRITRTVVGLRPYRPSGFVVRAERFGEKLVVHNYGHGGGGVTLSWGTAELAVRETLQAEEADVAVIGCGALGLATARLLQRAGRRVTIYAAKLPPETTSNIAGAQWGPFSVFEPSRVTPGFRAQFEEAARLAYRHFQLLLGPEYGVRWIENYFVGDEPVQLPSFVTSMPDIFPDVAEVPRSDHPFPTRYATRVLTMFIEPNPYLRRMIADVRAAGCAIVVREFRDRADLLSVPERVIVNCTGLGARDLFDDAEMIPVKGQLSVLLPQPEVDYIVIGSGGYMFPRSDGILLGGTFEREVWTLDVNEEAMRRIVEGHMRLFGG